MPARKRFGEWMLGVLFCALASSSHAANSLGFSVVSPELAGKRIAEAQVYKGFGCEGGNISPSLAWKNPPPGTRSYAVTIFDPDAPTGSGWWHWVMFNIPASVTSIPAGAGDPASGKAPQGAVQSRTDFGAPGYGGPCPPPGKPHRYVVTVFALKVDKIDADANASAAMVGFMLNANQLGRAKLTANYGRKR